MNNDRSAQSETSNAREHRAPQDLPFSPQPLAFDAFHLLDTGYCLASEHHIMRGGRRVQVACHALVALLHHPRHGWVLWDAGYAPRLLDATRRWPFRLYRWATPLRLRPEWAAARRLERLGVRAADVRHVVVSHLHADHIAGLRDFPAAALTIHPAAFELGLRLRGLRALRCGFIPHLLPDDFAARARALPAFAGPALPGLGPSHDLFGDGAALLVELPGHARGQIGMLARTPRGDVLLAADGAWQARAIRQLRAPHPLMHMIIDSARELRATLEGLHAFMAARPDVLVLPCHCPEALAHVDEPAPEEPL
jgi:glyoxylase-like metal-dependent hydrolase (beta-lactamase superfamily II)